LNDFNRNRSVQEIGTNLLTIVARARQRNIAVLLCGFEPLPVFSPSYEDRFRAMYPKVAARSGVPLIKDLLVRVYESPELVQRDLIHPGAASARVIAEDVFRAIRPMLSTAPTSR
jgi:acyl-CoA thioesterase I